MFICWSGGAPSGAVAAVHVAGLSDGPPPPPRMLLYLKAAPLYATITVYFLQSSSSPRRRRRQRRSTGRGCKSQRPVYIIPQGNYCTLLEIANLLRHWGLHSGKFASARFFKTANLPSQRRAHSISSTHMYSESR